MTKRLDGKIVGDAILERTRIEANTFIKKGIQPKLAILRVGEDVASKSYERNAIRTMNRANIEAETVELPAKSTNQDVLLKIDALNQDASVHGVIIMQPLPYGLSRQAISSRLDPKKDVDGIHPLNLGYLVENNKQALAPSTPQAVIEMLDYYEIDVARKDIVVIGSSPVVGKPLSIMLLNRKASVSTLHTFTRDVRQYTKQADILISATGALGLVDASFVKEDAVVIDVGFGYLDGKIVGDVQYDEVAPITSAISPVPGGVGSVTTSVLAWQVIQAVKLQQAD